jgi:catechol 2,3-dioxygenase-like lactoylglutathione lyase family enzyme
VVAGIHHVELWVADLAEARVEWGWLLRAVGFARAGEWPEGESWEAGGAYLTLTTAPALSGPVHDRRAPGVNHLAFRAGAARRVDAIMAEADQHGWRPLYHDRYPHAGGPGHYAGWLENSAGFKAEIVADDEPGKS